MNEEKKTATANVDLNKRPNASGTVGQAVTVVVNVGGKKEANVSLNASEEKPKVAGGGGDSGKVCESSKEKAAAFISKKLEENTNDDSKPSWTTVALKKTDK